MVVVRNDDSRYLERGNCLVHANCGISALAVGRQEQFHDYHLTWWHDMWPSFGPVILMLVCSVILLWKVPVGVSKHLLWLGVLLQLTVHSLTAFFWGPVQAAMATNDGMSAVLYHELMATHWFRVLFFLVCAGLMVWLVVRSLPNGRAQKARGFANEAA